MKKYFVPLVVSASLFAATSSFAHVSSLSNTWMATGSVTSKQPTKTPSGAKLDPANAVVKAKDVDASVAKALDLVEQRMKYQSAAVSRALEASSKNTSASARTHAEGLRNYVQNASAQVDKKLEAVSKEAKAGVNSAMDLMRANYRKIEDLARLAEKSMNTLEKETKGQTAISLASASLFFDNLPNKISVAASVAYFDGGSALAAGVAYSDPLGYRVSARVASDLKTFGISMGVGYSF